MKKQYFEFKIKEDEIVYYDQIFKRGLRIYPVDDILVHKFLSFNHPTMKQIGLLLLENKNKSRGDILEKIKKIEEKYDSCTITK